MKIHLKISIFIFLNVLFTQISHSQLVSENISTDPTLKFEYKALIIPALLIGYGVFGMENDGLELFNSEINEEIIEHIDRKVSVDDFSQYAPMLSVYTLDALGIKSKNNFKDKTLILSTAYILMGSSTVSLKQFMAVQRPDGTTFNSWPSGHTATAFMGAEFLYQEYKDKSIWYGVTGYLVAGSTGFFRMSNNRHWFTDVCAGAGIGILSTKIAYWVHPYLDNLLFKKKSSRSGSVSPFYNGNEIGLALSMKF